MSFFSGIRYPAPKNPEVKISRTRGHCLWIFLITGLRIVILACLYQTGLLKHRKSEYEPMVFWRERPLRCVPGWHQKHAWCHSSGTTICWVPPILPLLFWAMDYMRVPTGRQCEFHNLAWENPLAKRAIKLGGKRIDLSKITDNTYIIVGRTNHITPWRWCYRSVQSFGDDVEFMLANKSPAQTISNNPAKYMKYWIADEWPNEPHDWVTTAEEVPRSWRAHCIDWLKARSGEEVEAATMSGFERYRLLNSAPARYVIE